MSIHGDNLLTEPHNCKNSLAKKLEIFQIPTGKWTSFPFPTGKLYKFPPVCWLFDELKIIIPGFPHPAVHPFSGGALILFDGKMTGFRDAGGSPSMFFNPGDCIGLEHLGDLSLVQAVA